jgi:hypothetical protein
MARPKKKPAAPPSPEHIEAASKTSSIKQLVWLADAFHRVGARGPLQTQIPLFVAGEVAGKGFRRFNLPIDTWLETDSMRVGARDGLIFRFRPKNTLERSSSRGERDVIQAIEVSWTDVCNVFTTLADDIEARIKEVRQVEMRVDNLDKEIKSLIQRNSQMHGIITEGFKKAQELAKNHANDDVLEHIPGYGSF